MTKRKAKFSCGTISQLKDAFKELLKPCGRKKELKFIDSFDEKLKRSLVNESYYIRINDIVTDRQEGCCLELTTNIEVCLYYQCGKLEVQAQEIGLIEGEGFLVHALNPKNRPACIQYIRFNRMFTEPLDSDNEYIVKVCLDFDVKQTIDISTVL